MSCRQGLPSSEQSGEGWWPACLGHQQSASGPGKDNAWFASFTWCHGACEGIDKVLQQKEQLPVCGASRQDGCAS